MNGDKTTSSPYEVIQVESWAKFLDLVSGDTYKNWAFRGQADADWPLLSTLSRYFVSYGIDKSVWSHQEARILRVFQRKAHQFLQHVPAEDDSFQWLALMQHHGAPTRLLDLTWSPYVATFFALEKATTDAAVWALNVAKIRSLEVRIFKKFGLPDGVSPRRAGDFEKHLLPGTLPYIFVGEPYVMNRRLIAQSGTFAVPGMIDRPAEEILADYGDRKSLVAKIVLSKTQMRSEAMRELYNMNLTQATLFPDLDGLARSLAYELEFHWAFDPRTGKTLPGYKWHQAEDGERFPITT